MGDIAIETYFIINVVKMLRSCIGVPNILRQYVDMNKQTMVPNFKVLFAFCAFRCAFKTFARNWSTGDFVTFI